MPRRAAPSKRKISADPVYGSVMVQQLINKIMLDGKKSTAEKIVYDALSFIEERTGSSPGKALKNRLGNIPPRIEGKSRRDRGGRRRWAGGWPARSWTQRTTWVQASSGETTPTAWPKQTEHSHITGGDKE